MSNWISKLLGYAPAIASTIATGGATLPLLISQVVKDATGVEVSTMADLEKAVTEATPEQMLAFKTADQNFAVEMKKIDAAMLATVNKTIQAESGSSDWFVRRWRPFYGYCVAITWIIQMSGISFVFCYIAIKKPTELVALVGQLGLLMGSMTTLWGIALAVLGVSVHQRSKDKAKGVADPLVEAAAGATILGKIKSKIGL
tara:strand:- start:3734 stop:4336 length:603 start_codon:yes stop_codon:yes gene_type:complete